MDIASKTTKFSVTVILFFLLSSCGILPINPDSILHKAGLKVDGYEIMYQCDNLERDSSAWDRYEYSLKIKEDPQTLKSKLDALVAKNENWTFQDGRYVFDKEKEDYWELSIDVNLQHYEIRIEYLYYDIFF